MAKKTVEQYRDERDNLTSQIDEVFTTLGDYIKDNLSSSTSVLPNICIGEDGKLGLFEETDEVPLRVFQEGVTQDRIVVEREIIVSSDGQNKQTVEEIDFDGDDFVASRTGSIVEIALKNRTRYIVFLGDQDPTLTKDVNEGDFWFFSITGKLYVRYSGFWVQPHPQ